MTHIVCGSKPYYKINFSDIIDNNFKNIYRCNMLLAGNIYGTRDSTLQFVNCHIYNKIKTKKSLNEWRLQYKLMNNDNIIEHFVNWVNQKQSKVKYLNNNNTSNINRLLCRINSTLQLQKQSRCGLGAVAYIIEQDNKPFIIGFSLDNNDKTIGSQKPVSSCHNVYKEKKILQELHRQQLVDATFCAFEDYPLPLINCQYLMPTINSISILLKEYGICILKNYFNKDILSKLEIEYNNIFIQHTDKIEVLDKEECSNDERIFYAERYSPHIYTFFANDNLFNKAASSFSRNKNPKTLINRLTYEKGKIKNSGAGWHRDNHDCQFKAIMYLSDVKSENGPFTWITNSSKKFIGYPPPRTKSYNTRFHDKTIEELLQNNKNCKLIEICGEKGTIVLADTTYIHRGKIIEEGERKAITQYFF